MLSTCLGCGCVCDDIELEVSDSRIVDARNACALGAAWYGDGRGPSRALVSGVDATIDEAVAAASHLLGSAARPLVYLAPELSCEAQRLAIEIADVTGAMLDTITSSTARSGILAAQEQGRASVTLGEVRNRADVIVYWGVDPAARYPRYRERYAPGLGAAAGRVDAEDGRTDGDAADGGRSRMVVAVDVGQARAPADADRRVEVAVDREVEALTWLRAALRGEGVDHPEWATLAAVLAAGRYVAIVADGEPDWNQPHDEDRAAALIGLAEALNGPTRCGLSILRAGGNRSGADACLTSQTGYPMAVDFGRGYPQYRPFDAADRRLARGEVDAALVFGSAAAVPVDIVESLRRVRHAMIGPGASAGPLGAAEVVIDTGVPGIHEAGTALRMDDIPLPLHKAFEGPPEMAAIARLLANRFASRRRRQPERT